jgi:hypothetical protein
MMGPFRLEIPGLTSGRTRSETDTIDLRHRNLPRMDSPHMYGYSWGIGSAEKGRSDGLEGVRRRSFKDRHMSVSFR